MSKIEAKTSVKLPFQLKINLKENTSAMSLKSGKQLKPSLAKPSKVSTISKGCFMPCRMVPTCTVHGYLRDHFIHERCLSNIWDSYHLLWRLRAISLPNKVVFLCMGPLLFMMDILGSCYRYVGLSLSCVKSLLVDIEIMDHFIAIEIILFIRGSLLLIIEITGSSPFAMWDHFIMHEIFITYCRDCKVIPLPCGIVPIMREAFIFLSWRSENSSYCMWDSLLCV